jgi:hypothetical protein
MLMLLTRRLAVEADQGQAARGIEPALKVGGGFGDNHFEGGPDVTFEQVTAAGGAIGLAQNNVGVEHWFAILAEGHVTEKGKHLGLFGDRNAAVCFAVEGVVTENGSLEGADGLQGGRAQVVIGYKLSQAGDDLISGIEDNGPRPLAGLAGGKKFRSHRAELPDFR